MKARLAWLTPHRALTGCADLFSLFIIWASLGTALGHEIGAGHTVTALYEVVAAGSEPNPAASVPPVDPLKYQHDPMAVATSLGKAASPELLTVKLRYKESDGETSKLLERPFVDNGIQFASAAPDLKFAAAVAELG